MIALFLFAVFIAVFATSNGFNISNSELMKEEILLRQLASNKMSEIIENPPKEFSKSLTLGPGDTKTIEGFENYTSTVVYKELLLPDYKKMMGISEEDANENKSNQFEEKIYEKVRDNLEEIIWQVEVTVKNKVTEYSYSLSTWLYNHKAKVDVQTF